MIISRVGGQSVLCSLYHWFCRYLSRSRYCRNPDLSLFVSVSKLKHSSCSWLVQCNFRKRIPARSSINF
ncbi:hypothetical protein BDQ94DRAFT_141177 [Aspergillus welwitschiae]|uniref:Uncharacterized protein n=1 Tax=Aspergillus welwitschiae TaxID=1341132 RepID=A0A3F3Q6Y2_9EURO|nr:hypothetical protein BDQ94DRAFT_141177 [Aspergillus welwitschiae]RDH34940.1 hypothetical protein BDQ94DRAFT_141177 [Aspergillus welwitschiae]